MGRMRPAKTHSQQQVSALRSEGRTFSRSPAAWPRPALPRSALLNVFKSSPVLAFICLLPSFSLGHQQCYCQAELLTACTGSEGAFMRFILLPASFDSVLEGSEMLCTDDESSDN